ncbi:(2Fe-2S)-binding protein [Lentibacillus sp. Marseille-P4043]|uniref:(2Fe-2S)-binding protein n=1 Tax=Lentibacillus sp. Marseille-P4043 TaxID=2040293 RepID=UPI000D0AEB05|nr:(2Fe-2S)-binding protein [Lentibacillus sp. Marseille-P4043]
MIESLHTSQLVTLTINGHTKELFVRNAETLLYTLRDQLGLMGAKPGCENGDCGTCTILIDGTPINSCHILTVEAVGHQITTIEGLTDSSIQNAFIKNWAIQCGYCTPGYVLNSYALVQNCPDADDETINEWLESNLCRCTGYQEIKEAVKNTLNARKQNG